MTWNFSSVPHEQRAGLSWLVIAIVVHGGALAFGIHVGWPKLCLAIGSFTFFLALVGAARWIESRRVARRVLEVREPDGKSGMALYQGVLRSRDPWVRVEVGGRLLKVRAPKTTLARRDARPLTPLERVSVLGWANAVGGDIGESASTIELDRALIHPGDVESLRQRILQHGDFYAMRWVTASLCLLLVDVGASMFM